MADFQNFSSVVERLKNVDVDLFLFEVCDFFGRPQTVYVPRSNLEEAVEDGVELPVRAVVKENDGGNSTEFLDKICSLRADPTAAILRHPIHRNMAYILAEPYIQGSPMASYPRFVARKYLGRLAELGFTLKSSFRLGFSLTSKKTDVQYIDREGLIKHVFDFSDRFWKGKKFEVESMHAGVVADRMDGTFKEVLGIKGADFAQYFKTFIREAAGTFLYDVSFLDKPYLMHFRHSLWDVNGKTDLTSDPNSPRGLSQSAQHWMAGILAHMPAIVRFTHPTTSCWNKHQLPNSRWQKDGTGSSLRLHVGGQGKTFIEARQGTGRCNPYLLMAAVVAAGIDGIEKKLPLPEAGTDAKKMPTNVGDATDAFQADKLLMTAFVPEKYFLKLMDGALCCL